ncbi:hypothetical protein KUCAC02_010260, partial [Chaenocephalus aceratus]
QRTLLLVFPLYWLGPLLPTVRPEDIALLVSLYWLGPLLPTVAEQFSRAFKINELKTEVSNRLAMLEKRVEHLAVRYNDISPLENHHCAVAFQIFSQPDCNIFSTFDPESFKQIRQGTITLILATDMARHGEILDSFKQKVDNFDYTDEEHSTCLKMVLIKCCDISNEVRPMEVAEPWVDCLLEEYFMQSDREKAEGLPVAPFMDREKVTKPTAQIGFIKFVLIPMFETVMKIEETMVQPLRESRDRYEELKQIDDAMNEVQKMKSENLTMKKNSEWQTPRSVTAAGSGPSAARGRDGEDLRQQL